MKVNTMKINGNEISFTRLFHFAVVSKKEKIRKREDDVYFVNIIIKIKR